MEFIDEDLNQYCEDHTTPETEVLKKLNRETHANVMMPRMLSGHIQGRTLAMFSQMIKPENILEIGTYTGYSGISLADGLTENGTLHTIDINDELEDMVRKYFAEAGIADKVKYHLGNAIDIIPTLDVTFDLVFIDADKINYSNYFDLVIDKVRPGGFIIADNVLWSGKVLEKFRKKLDKDTEALLEFNQKVQNDDRVENVLLPIRDGLLVIRKK
ncbi:O-methyltransferase [Adhaeribacter sp. BT258]|uniref:O-methyltransferase n=1 Tax=Adhaeribacter terrigena TaxID=2793070 RepID=A0ABS1C4Q0_9BACT|nr:O-methyltransferase [Adhaeribacter terrigena]MBK0404152.1 O-methyltransferase [Adhaeribacter terrigena]